MMIPYFKYGLDVSRHELPGVYVCTIGKNKRQSSRLPVSITCTIRESRGGDLVDGEPRELNAEIGPITLCYQGSYTIMRPWNPHTCVFAAGVHNRLVHFPIRPRSRVFVLGCPLQTLSHLADILGPTGQLIGVIPKDSPNQPTQAELGRFLVGHRHVWVVTEDIQNASAAGYELLLSLPVSSKHAFLMALHPRLGADSPARVLAGAEKHQEILKKIFGFIEFPEALKAKCLVLCHSNTERSVDTIRDVVSTHIDILQRSPASKAQTGKDSSGSSGDEDQKKQRQKKDKGSVEGEDQRGQLWVLLDLRTDHIVTTGDSPDVNSKLSEVVEKMKRLGSGLRTGMQAKEQLLLTPYFPNHSLLLLKYASHRDERRGDPAKARNGLESHGSEAQGSRVAAPSTSAMPVPMFGKLGGGAAAAAAAPPADAAATGGASGSAAAPAAAQAQHGPPGGPPSGPNAGGRDGQRHGSGPVGAAPPAPGGGGGAAAAASHGRTAGHHGHPGAGADRRQGAQRAAEQQGQRQHPHQQHSDYGYYLGQLWHNEASPKAGGGGYDAGPHWQQRGGRPGADHGASAWGQGGGGAGASSGGKRGGGGVGAVEGYAVPPLLRQMQQQGGHGCGGCGGDGPLEPGPPPGLGAAQGHWAAPPGLEQAPSHGYAPGPHGMQGGMRGPPPGPRGGPVGPRHGGGGGYDPQHQQPQQPPPQQRRQYPGGDPQHGGPPQGGADNRHYPTMRF